VSLIDYARSFFAPILSALAPLLFAVGVVAIKAAEQVALGDETRRVLSELVRRGYELERIGRQLAYASKGLILWGADTKWIADLNLWYESTLSTVNRLVWRLAEAGPHPLANAVDMLHIGLLAARRTSDLVLEALNKYGTVRREAKIVDISASIARDLKQTLEALSREVNIVTGAPCIWILGRIKPLEEYTVAAMYNDLTACHHRIVDYLSLVIDPETTAVSERVISLRGNPVLVDGCLKWERVLTELYMHGLVDPSDYRPTICIVTGDRAGIRVGTIPSHATHVELVDGAVRAVFYDVDEAVHKEVMKLAEKLGIRVVEHSPAEYTVLEVPVEKRDLLFKRLVPFISSMDERTRSPDRWRMLYYDKSREELRGIGEAELAYRAPEEFRRRFGVELDC
jgi:hypothetical protein